MMGIVKLMRGRAASYGALRKSSVTAIALDRGADHIERLEAENKALRKHATAMAAAITRPDTHTQMLRVAHDYVTSPIARQTLADTQEAQDG